MARVLVIAAIVAALALVVAAGGSNDCECDRRAQVTCYENLNDCSREENGVVENSSNGNACGSPPYQFFSCTDKPDICRYVGNCTLPLPKCRCKHDIKCYDTLQQCESERGGTTFNEGKNTDCLAIGKPVYACWEEPAVCRSTDTCEVIPDGHGNQDPHFRGFDGSDYYFDGEAGQDYNIISDVNLQLNAHFIRLNHLKGTYMGRLGLRFGEHALSFDPHFGVFFNNSLMTSGTVDLAEGSFSISTVDGRFRFVFENDIYHLVVRVAVEKGDREEAYLNIDASLIGTPTDPHGILGQTARPRPAGMPFKVEGKEEDYHVRDGLLGTRFAFNKFVGTPSSDEQPVTATGRRLVRHAASQPLFEAVAQ